MLGDTDFRGRQRKLLLHPNRNGFFYVLDRVSGEFLNATPTGVKVCPSVRDASNWMSPSYNLDTQLLYVPTLEQCDIVVTSTKMPEPGKFYMRAIDPKTGARRWEYPMTGPATMWAGTVSRAGGLLFFGDDDGQLVARWMRRPGGICGTTTWGRS